MSLGTWASNQVRVFIEAVTCSFQVDVLLFDGSDFGCYLFTYVQGLSSHRAKDGSCQFSVAFHEYQLGSS